MELPGEGGSGGSSIICHEEERQPIGQGQKNAQYDIRGGGKDVCVWWAACKESGAAVHNKSTSSDCIDFISIK